LELANSVQRALGQAMLLSQQALEEQKQKQQQQQQQSSSSKPAAGKTTGQLKGCSQLLADIMTTEDEDIDKLDQSTLSARSAAEASNSAAQPQPGQQPRQQSQPPLKQHREFAQTVYSKPVASLATVANQKQYDYSYEFGNSPLFESTKPNWTAANQKQQQERHSQNHRLESTATLATVANQQQRQSGQTLRPEPTVPKQQQQHQFAQTLRPASLPIIPTGSECPVRDTDREHQHRHQHQRRSVCRHGNPVKSRHRQSQPQPAVKVISDAAGDSQAKCTVGGCQSSQELLARLESTESALERSRAEAEARLAELCARENELMRLRHDALRREARLRAEADREREARACAEARADALEKETRRLASALGERDLQLRACQEKMRRINRSLGYIAKASSEFGVESPSAAAAAAVAAASKIAASDAGFTDKDDDATEADDATTDCDVSMSTGCSCAAEVPHPSQPKTYTVLPSPLAAGQRHQQQRPIESVQPSPPTLDVCKPPPQAEKSAATIAAGKTDAEDADDRDFRLGLARIDDQIRRLQASLKSPSYA
uniref:AF4/FMR2 family member 4 n=1 Tax=Macrostomum lignano TaxID=282301 RepID=A0A1I8I025_9PLAT